MGRKEETAQIQRVVNEILNQHSNVTPLTQRMSQCLSSAIKRRAGNSKDILLAAVDHYFVARKDVVEGGQIAYDLMVVKVFGYEYVKFVPFYRWGLELLNEICGDPDPSVSLSSTHSIEWGIRGANHGMTDYKSEHP